jgi:hypothetical protein
MANINNCRCGFKVDVDYSSVNEYFGGSWQNVDITCPHKCGYSVDITFNSDIKGDCDRATKLAIQSWNIFVENED